MDLDETLIFADEKPLDRAADFIVFNYHVYLRPYLEPFLRECAQHFELAVWSSASDAYVEAVVDHVIPYDIPLHFIWGRSKATLRRVSHDEDGRWYDPYSHQSYRKPLAKLKKAGWSLSKILILDDTPEKSAQNFGNAIYPRPFEGDLTDDELRLLMDYLPSLAVVENVRAIEKRNWRAGMIGST